MTKQEILDCGHVPTSLPPNHAGTGYGTGPDGKKRCYDCCNKLELEAFMKAGDEGKPFTAYVSNDGTLITTWPGGTLARVSRSRVFLKAKRWGDPLHYYYVKDSKNRSWSGRGQPGMCITLRPHAH